MNNSCQHSCGIWKIKNKMSKVECDKKYGMKIVLLVGYSCLVAVAIGFGIAAAIETAQTGAFSQYWIICFIFLGIAIVLTLVCIIGCCRNTTIVSGGGSESAMR